MPTLSRNQIFYGALEDLPLRMPLQAGPISMIYEAGDLRYISFEGREVIRRIYSAVRDCNWGTVKATLSNERISVASDSFSINYRALHQQGDIDFLWNAQITGEPSGRIRFAMDGQACSTFRKNRIGFCVLHPVPECAGAPCLAEYVDGSSAAIGFPMVVAAEQPVPGLCNLRGISHEIGKDIWAALQFEGDVFETEDQRNWIDASFKTFCTPLCLPYPVEMKAGSRVRQAVVLTLDYRVRSPGFSKTLSVQSGSLRPAPQTPLRISLDPRPTRKLPAIGLSLPDRGHSLTAEERTRLARLRLSHLRFDLRCAEKDWADLLRSARSESELLGVPLELALHFPVKPLLPPEQLRAELRSVAGSIARILVLRDGQDTTDSASFDLVNSWLSDLAVVLGMGTNADFYQLNQFRPIRQEKAGFICWSVNPQVHAFDNSSLVETPPVIAAQIESARSYFPGKPLVVSPITLKPRFNPVITTPEAAPAPSEWPPNVDPRQASLFGAGWTIASLKHLAEAGAASATFYETIGACGVMETDRGSRFGERFPSLPGSVFPIYHTLADVSEFANGEAGPTVSEHPRLVESMLLCSGSRARLLLANLSPDTQEVQLQALAPQVQVRFLDETNAVLAMTEPEQYRPQFHSLQIRADGTLEVELRPYALATIDMNH